MKIIFHVGNLSLTIIFSCAYTSFQYHNVIQCCQKVKEDKWSHFLIPKPPWLFWKSWPVNNEICLYLLYLNNLCTAFMTGLYNIIFSRIFFIEEVWLITCSFTCRYHAVIMVSHCAEYDIHVGPYILHLFYTKVPSCWILQNLPNPIK